jgi:hypothetical protein
MSESTFLFEVDGMGVFTCRLSQRGQVIYNLPFHGELHFAARSRSMSLSESRREFEGDDYGRKVSYTVFWEGKARCFHAYVIEGYGNGYGPSDLEVVLDWLDKVVCKSVPSNPYGVLRSYLATTRMLARQELHAIQFGYEGT